MDGRLVDQDQRENTEHHLHHERLFLSLHHDARPTRAQQGQQTVVAFGQLRVELADLPTVHRRRRAQKYGGEAVTTVVARPSTVGDIIVDEAQAAGSELIVMGTHGRTGVKRLVFGSVAEHVVRHAPCPVVTVRA